MNYLAPVGFVVAVALLFLAIRSLNRLLNRCPLWVPVVVCGASLAVGASSLVLVSDATGMVRTAQLVLSGLAAFVALPASLGTLLGRVAKGGSALDQWASAHGLELSEATAPLAAAYVLEGHRLRLVCTFGALPVAMALSTGLGLHVHLPWVTWMLVGYLVGCVWSEAWLTRIPSGASQPGPRSAALDTRRLSAYLRPSLRLLQFATPALVVVLAALVSGRPSRITDAVDPTMFGLYVSEMRSEVVWAAGAMVLVSVLVLLVQRHIVGKPQPVAGLEVVALDDAVRSSSVQLLSTTVSAIGLVLAAVELTVLGTTVDRPWEQLVTFVGLCLMPLAFVAWRFLGHVGWRVRRLVRDGRSTGPLDGSVVDPT